MRAVKPLIKLVRVLATKYTAKLHCEPPHIASRLIITKLGEASFSAATF
jgi:hypothetical protein